MSATPPRTPVCALLLAISAGVAAPVVHAQNPSIYIVNQSSQTISFIYASLTDSDTWGDDRLERDVLPAGERFPLRLPLGDCIYDVKVVYGDDQEEERRAENLCQIAEMVFTGTAAPSTTTNPDFDVVNQSAQAIVQLYVSATSSDSWGEDRLPSTLPAGGRFPVVLPRDGECDYDLKVVYQDASTEEQRDQRVCALFEVVFNGADVAAPPSSPADPDPAPSISWGTGFFISSQGQALTNNHVTEECRGIDVYLEGQRVPAQLVRRDELNDLALLRVQVPGPVPYVRFRAAPSIRAGEGVMVAGFPLPQVLQNGLNVTVGNVSALAGLGGNTALIQMTAPVQPGNSGGPLLDLGGHLVGVVVSKLDAMRIAESTGDIPQNINFAIQGAVVRLFVEAGGLRVEEQPTAADLPIGDVGDLAREFTFQVECRQ